MALAFLLGTLGGVCPLRADALSFKVGGRLNVSNVAAEAPSTINVTGDGIVPIAWHRAGAREGTLTLLLMPGAGDSVVVEIQGRARSNAFATSELPRVTVDSRAYERISTWRPTASATDRRVTLLLAAAFAVTLLLAAVLHRGRAIAIVGVAATWAIGLSLAANRRPTLLTHDEPDGSRWFLATQAQTLRVPIQPGKAWVPVVESAGQLRALSPQIQVEGDAATLELTLLAGSKVGFRSPP